MGRGLTESSSHENPLILGQPEAVVHPRAGCLLNPVHQDISFWAQSIAQA